MQSAVNLYPLIGVAVIVVGFLLRFNPMLIVTVAAIVTGLAAHFSFDHILTAIGSGFIKTRVIPLIILLPLAVIGLLERHGLRERAQNWIAGIRAATPGRLLIVYLFVRQVTAALGLTGLGGHPQMVRPLVSPMAEGAALTRYGRLSDAVRNRLKAFSAATDNVGLFFGEDIFVAFGAIVLMVTFLKEAGISVLPMHVAVWGIPTAIAAFVIHAFRLYRLDRWLARQAQRDGGIEGKTDGSGDSVPVRGDKQSIPAAGSRNASTSTSTAAPAPAPIGKSNATLGDRA